MKAKVVKSWQRNTLLFAAKKLKWFDCLQIIFIHFFKQHGISYRSFGAEHIVGIIIIKNKLSNLPPYTIQFVMLTVNKNTSTKGVIVFLA